MDWTSISSKNLSASTGLGSVFCFHHFLPIRSHICYTYKPGNWNTGGLPLFLCFTPHFCFWVLFEVCACSLEDEVSAESLSEGSEGISIGDEGGGDVAGAAGSTL